MLSISVGQHCLDQAWVSGWRTGGQSEPLSLWAGETFKTCAGPLWAGQERTNHLTGWNQEPTDLALGRRSPKGGEKMGLGGNTFRKPCPGRPGQWEGLAHPLLPAWAKQKG